MKTWHSAQVNDGQGWGIPVSREFILTKEMLQVIGIRLLLAATLIKTFLDTELGIQDLEDWIRLASKTNRIAGACGGLSSSAWEMEIHG